MSLQQDRKLIETLEETSLRRTSDLLREGFSRELIREAVAAEEAYEVIPGVICSAHVWLDQHLECAAWTLLTGAVTWGPSAAYRHDLSNVVPHMHDLIVPSTVRMRPPGPERFWRTKRSEPLTAGVEEYTSHHGLKYLMTNEPRTVADLYRELGWRQHARDALLDYWDRGTQCSGVHEMAKTMGVWHHVGPHLEMVSFFLDRGHLPKG